MEKQQRRTSAIPFPDIKAHSQALSPGPMVVVAFFHQAGRAERQRAQHRLRCPEVIKSVLNYISKTIRIIITF